MSLRDKNSRQQHNNNRLQPKKSKKKEKERPDVEQQVPTEWLARKIKDRFHEGVRKRIIILPSVSPHHQLRKEKDMKKKYLWLLVVICYGWQSLRLWSSYSWEDMNLFPVNPHNSMEKEEQKLIKQDFFIFFFLSLLNFLSVSLRFRSLWLPLVILFGSCCFFRVNDPWSDFLSHWNRNELGTENTLFHGNYFHFVV